MSEEKLEPDFKRRWVNALRSGEYNQGGGSLYNKICDSYCCLGVACKISGYRGHHMGDSDFIPFEFNDVPFILQDQNDITVTLANMNDGLSEKQITKHTFSEIADWIEQNL